MALPVTISGGEVGEQNSYHGPVKSSGGNFYTVLRGPGPDTLTEGEFRAFKAIDPTSSFTEQDTGNRPVARAGNVEIISMNISQVADDLHVVVQQEEGISREIWYARFDMSSDTWQDVDGAGNEEVLVDDGNNGTTAQATDIAVLSASYGVGSAFVKIRVVYQGATDMDMGGDFERIDESNSVDDGVNWSAPTQIDNGVSQPGTHFTGPRIVKHPSDDQCFIFMSDATNLTLKAIAGDDTLRTYRDTGIDVTSDTYPLTHGIGITRSTVDKIRIGYREITSNDLAVLEFDAFTADEDRTETQSDVHADDVQVDNGSINACLAEDGETIRGLMVKSSDDDLYEFFDDDADSYTLQGSAHRTGTFNSISTRVYDRFGTKLAMIYDDAGTVYYDEISIGAPPSGPPAGTLALLGVGV